MKPEGTLRSSIYMAFKKTITVPAIALAILNILAAPGALACASFAASNKNYQNNHKKNVEALAKYETALKNLESSCQKQHKEIAEAEASAAGAESCIAFKDNAKMHERLYQASLECEEKITKFQVKLSTLAVENISAFTTSMKGVVKADKIVRKLLPRCKSEFDRAEKLYDAARITHSQSSAVLVEGHLSIDKYQKLKTRTESIIAASSGTYERCGIASIAIEKNPLRGKAQVDRKPSSIFLGNSPQKGKSEITGKIVNSSLSSTSVTNKVSKAFRNEGASPSNEISHRQKSEKLDLIGSLLSDAEKSSSSKILEQPGEAMAATEESKADESKADESKAALPSHRLAHRLGSIETGLVAKTVHQLEGNPLTSSSPSLSTGRNPDDSNKEVGSPYPALPAQADSTSNVEGLKVRILSDTASPQPYPLETESSLFARVKKKLQFWDFTDNGIQRMAGSLR
jgi:hypothetical protein